MYKTENVFDTPNIFYLHVIIESKSILEIVKWFLLQSMESLNTYYSHSLYVMFLAIDQKKWPVKLDDWKKSVSA